MQFVDLSIMSKRPQLTKRTSSATFHSKKVKTLLASRQACDETVIYKQQKQTQQPSAVISRTLNYHRKEKSHVDFFKGQVNPIKCQNKVLLQIIKPIKHEKSSQENLLLKNCNKSKLIYWSKDLLIQGRQRYLLVSADLLIDQDNFWEKVSTDNCQINGNLASVNYNSTNLARNRNINIALPPKYGYSTNNFGSNGQQQNLSKRNPLLSSNKVNLLVREWKSLHSRVDSQERRLVVLWLIRRQSSYGYLMEFAQTYQLPLHGIFYVKKKRSNQFFDLGLIKKEINQKFFQSIINSHPSKLQIDSPKTLRSIQQNTDFKRSKSRQPPKLTRPNKKQSSQQLSIQINSHQTIKIHSMQSTTRKFIKSTTKQQIQMLQHRNQSYNDQNCQQSMNAQISKQFSLSKNTASNKKKSLVSIITDDSRVRKVVKKFPSLLIGGMQRPTTVKILQSVEKIESYEKQSSVNLCKRYISPLIADEDNQLEIEELQEDLLVQIDEEQQQKKEYNNSNKGRFMSPEILIFQGLKCNIKDCMGVESYQGKLPLVFSYHDRRYKEVKQNLSQFGIQITQNNFNNNSKGQNVRMFYFKYQMIRQSMLQRVNSFVKEILMTKQSRSNNEIQACNNISCYQVVSKLPEYIQQTIQKTIRQLSALIGKREQKKKSSQQLLVNISCQQQHSQFTLSQQQQQALVQRTQKELQQIKKKLINDVIVMKGRSYTFQNGQSVYYYVGGMFKRNYNLFYNEYYAKYEAELKSQLVINKNSTGRNTNNNNNSKTVNNNKDFTESSSHISIPQLSPVQFFHINNTY